MCTDRRHAAGFTLAELLLLIVVLGVALAGILLVINTTTTHSADPMVQKQAMAIAESMMEEVLVQPFGIIGTAPGTKDQTTRTTFDDAQDYNGFQTNGIYRIEDGTPIAGLENYTVNVAVVTATVGGVAGALEVTVTVTGPINTNYALTGYKLDY